MSNTAKHYFECHVTIEPIFDTRLEQAAAVAKQFGFKIASLLMQKRKEDTAERSKYDTFMTGHGKDLQQMQENVRNLVRELKAQEFIVWRYKIEDTVMDSRINDELGILV